MDKHTYFHIEKNELGFKSWIRTWDKIRVYYLSPDKKTFDDSTSYSDFFYSDYAKNNGRIILRQYTKKRRLCIVVYIKKDGLCVEEDRYYIAQEPSEINIRVDFSQQLANDNNLSFCRKIRDFFKKKEKKTNCRLTIVSPSEIEAGKLCYTYKDFMFPIGAIEVKNKPVLFDVPIPYSERSNIGFCSSDEDWKFKIN